ncbi:GTP-binding protein [Saccharopolyspora sp. HNM0983]|uniref:GTP-binding protein n=1 Tax=Saccharopolyspora montiporae TaxID=2781240 RepID=A0A929FZ29_9PSEU|nr:GTP-binding protein [Saccharopolyspora sp. HNM0983]MBE9373959.1 GTP-binding protein [Saccharopolyspora sp. HNM0983]
METGAPGGRSTDQRTPLIVVCGLDQDQTAATAETVRAGAPGTTALLHHDLHRVGDGFLDKRVRHRDRDIDSTVELVHGCVSCTLREDLLPELRRLSATPGVEHIVLHLDPLVEPEAICWSLQQVPVDGRTVDEDVVVHAVLNAVDGARWLADASSEDTLADRGLGGGTDDERTIAQLAVGHAEFADAIVFGPAAEDGWTEVRTREVLRRLAPATAWTQLDGLDVADLLARIPDNARRGDVDGAHGPLLRGQPPMEPDSGVEVLLFEDRRPFHPQRLHEALDALLDGVVRTRGRAWIASRPDSALWLESAGGGLAVGDAGPWLAALPEQEWTQFADERRLRASLQWDEHYGDRAQEIVVITHDADAAEISRRLRAALLTDEELAAGRDVWAQHQDPFEWHSDDCSDEDPADADLDPARGSGGC